MNVVVDTNVVASAIFFGGKPKEIIDLIMKDKVYAYASKEILDEYTETIEYLSNNYSEKKPLISFCSFMLGTQIFHFFAWKILCKTQTTHLFSQNQNMRSLQNPLNKKYYGKYLMESINL